MKYIISLLFILQAINNYDSLAKAQLPLRDRHLCRGGDFKSNTIQKNQSWLLDDLAWYSYFFPDDFVKAVELEKTVDSLASKLKEQAAGGDALQKGSVNYDNDELSLFMVMQCTPDLTIALNVYPRQVLSSVLEKRSLMQEFSLPIVMHLDPPSEFDSHEC
ncbi:hypothetical protein L1987_58734 [Smallanthus sonchifolius]|uniref:Uncharacterized protein n=1 Tax=Smallanthus sonchifolius TaxID=185202 RepID=A0ACB9D3A1_9ASTR|nr:hypothetical protein L1987_58734 [Smallanthus sonchifolius]